MPKIEEITKMLVAVSVPIISRESFAIPIVPHGNRKHTIGAAMLINSSMASASKIGTVLQVT